MNHTLIIGFDKEVEVGVAFVEREHKSELDGNNLGPTNVAAIGIPTRGKFPGIPLVTQDNTDTPGC